MTNSNITVCKYCKSEAIVKRGKYKGIQLYWCKVCQRKFKGDDALFHMKVPAEYVSRTLSDYYTGKSIGNIAIILKQETGYYPSKHIVYYWVDKFTNVAINHFKQYKPKVGDVWVADETMLDMNNRKVWFWDIIDTKTRFLLASRVSLSRTTEDAQLLMERAYERAGKAPKVIITDKLRSYLDGIEQTFGADTDHIEASPFAGEESTAIVERFQGTLKDRTKVMRGFKDMDTLIHFTDGFLAYYNFIRPHESLEGKTPAEVARINYDVKSWGDVCHISVSKEDEIKTHKLPSIRIVKTKTELPKAQTRRKRASA
jgi:transposase-like protein